METPDVTSGQLSLPGASKRRRRKENPARTRINLNDKTTAVKPERRRQRCAGWIHGESRTRRELRICGVLLREAGERAIVFERAASRVYVFLLAKAAVASAATRTPAASLPADASPVVFIPHTFTWNTFKGMQLGGRRETLAARVVSPIGNAYCSSKTVQKWSGFFSPQI